MSLLDFLGVTFKDLLNPQFYIDNGGLWLVIFIVFAETGLFAGFFLPGDALLFVVGIFSAQLVESAIYASGNQWVDLGILWLLITTAGILGNFVGYWFGKKSGPFLFQRKDSFFFKKKYLLQAHEFYEKNGGWAIVVARFVPFVRTFAPIVAGIVKMDKRKFTFYNVMGCMLWVGTMLMAGHFLHRFIKNQYNYDMTRHLEVIVLVIVAVTTFPVIIKILRAGKSSKKSPRTDNE